MLDWSLVRCVVLDAVGTIIHAEPTVARAYFDAGRRFGSRYSLVDVEQRFSSAYRRRHRDLDEEKTDAAREVSRWRQTVADVFDDVRDQNALFDALWQHFAAAEHWRLYGDVEDAVRWIRDSGRKVVVGSNFDRRLINIGRQLFPELPVYCSEQLGCSKPSPMFFSQLAVELACAAESLLMIGDDPIHDDRGAKQAGWQSVLLQRTKPGVPGSLSSLSQLAQHLE